MSEDSGRVVIVTGGSRGIGAAVAKLAARDGWAVAVNYRTDRASADDVVAEIARSGGRAMAFPADVAVEGEVQRLFADAAAQLGPVRGLVNNAGILRPRSFVTDISLARWTDIFATNVLGSFLCAREAARLMSTRLGGPGGAIVNLSSMAAVLGAPADAVDYAASKGAIDTLTIGLGRELASEGVRVNAIRPGLIDTDMQIDSGDPERARRLAPTVPMRRVGTVEEIAEAVVWLLSDKASYCTGAILTVSGGR
jgi:NAD(P)-dependent dehydrogenase (short-subunit alcohol dehydrogenase family)